MENPEDSYNEKELIIGGIQSYRPDFSNDKMLNDLVTFLRLYEKNKSAEVYQLAISICSISNILPFIT